MWLSRILIAILILPWWTPVEAQNVTGDGGSGSVTIDGDTTVPSTCTPLTGPNALFLDTDDETFHVCTSNDTMTQIGGAESDTLATVTLRGNTSTGNDETNPFQIFGTGAQSTYGLQFTRTSTGESIIDCVESAGVGECSWPREVKSGFFGGFQTGGTWYFRYNGTTHAIDTATIDCTTAGVACTRKIVVTIPLASCPNGTASSALNRPGNGATVPTPTCLDAGNVEAPHLSFAGGAVNAGSITFKVPSQFTSLTSVDFSIEHASAAASPTGNIEWDISTVCRAPGETIDGTFNAVQTITDAAVAQNTYNTATQTSLTITGCAPGERMTTLISRDGTNDTNNDAAMAFEATWTFTGVE